MRRLAFAAAALVALAACDTVPPRAGTGTVVDLERTFLALDSDRDGVLTRAEAGDSALLERRFAQADANGDGVLSRYEYNSPAWRPLRREPD